LNRRDRNQTLPQCTFAQQPRTWFAIVRNPRYRHFDPSAETPDGENLCDLPR